MTVEDDIDSWWTSNIDPLFPAPEGQEAETCAEASWRILTGPVRSYPNNQFEYGPTNTDLYKMTITGGINHSCQTGM